MSRSAWMSTLGMLVGLWFVAGCHDAPQEEPADTPRSRVPAEPLRVLIVDDAELASAIPRQWQARADRELVIRQTTTAQLLAAATRRLGTDVVIYPSGLLGELATRQLLAPVPDKALLNETFARRDLFELSRLREVAWGRVVMAVSFGSPQWCLLYRRDLFERLQVEPPRTWDDYQQLVARLANRRRLGDAIPAGDQPWHPVIEPLGPGWGGQLLLARSAAYAQHRSQFSTLFDYRTMTPLIGGPPFARALRELVAAAKHGPSEAQRMTPSDARREFLLGHCAMALTWPNRADDQSREGVATPAAFAELPGAIDAYNFRTQTWERRGDEADRRVTLAAVSGRLGSVTRECSELPAAANLLVWLTGRLSADVCCETKAGTLFRESHLPTASRWLDRQFDEQAAKTYGDAARQAQNRTSWLSSVRIPGRERYLAALDLAVQEAIAGTSPEESLRKAAAAWETITESLGREPQRRAYMKSVGLDP